MRVPLRFFIGRPSFRLPKENDRELPDAVARRSWVLRGVTCLGVAEEARTRGFVPPALAGFTFLAAVLLAACQIRRRRPRVKGRGSQAGRRARKFFGRPEHGLLAFALTPPLRRHSDPEDRPSPGPSVTPPPGGSRHAQSPSPHPPARASRCRHIWSRRVGGMRRQQRQRPHTRREPASHRRLRAVEGGAARGPP